MAKKTNILELLKIVAPILPAPIYWEDVNSILLGGNEAVFKATGAVFADAYIGKSLFELYPKEMAEHIKRHNEEVMRTGQILSQEEIIKDISTNQTKYFTAIKAPLHDDNGKVIGIVGTSVDITSEKEAERLKLENEIHQNQAKEQEKFLKIANQVAHDIRSPLASLKAILKSCTELPEKKRVNLRRACIRIEDIANHMLNQYTTEKSEIVDKTEEHQPVLLSATLLEIASEKKFEYEQLPIQFTTSFDNKSHFVFINVQLSSFKRSLSNLINNAVDAYNKKNGKITLILEADSEWVKVIVKDYGKGMPTTLIDKIRKHIAITQGKKEGHGIGLMQVHETLERNHASMKIDSSVGKGTQIILIFPRLKAPSWCAEEIKLGSQDIVVVLDDDPSIHGAWDLRFEEVKNDAPDITLYHFEIGQQALDFILALPDADKKKVFLLTDYELLKQELNGLDVIKQTKVENSILVTSHYVDANVRQEAVRLGTKILPKQLASEISISICERETVIADQENLTLKSVHALVIDDDEMYIETLQDYVFDDDFVVDYYKNPDELYKNISNYAKETRIFLDNNYESLEIKGIEIANDLHEKGYTRLCLLSGESFTQTELPSWLKVIAKMDFNKIKDW